MKIVSLFSSTASHNYVAVGEQRLVIVSLFSSTASHNHRTQFEVVGVLYLSFLLQQATTKRTNQ